VIVAICAIGADTVNNAMQDIWFMLGSMTIMWSNWLVGSITTLAMIMLFWPLISRVLRAIVPANRTSCPNSGRSSKPALLRR
jgi:putative tricarboxylic transport membrane protein